MTFETVLTGWTFRSNTRISWIAVAQERGKVRPAFWIGTQLREPSDGHD
jgi:hypothetical protein